MIPQATQLMTQQGHRETHTLLISQDLTHYSYPPHSSGHTRLTIWSQASISWP